MRNNKLLCTTSVVLILFSILFIRKNTNSIAKTWWDTAVVYQIYPRSFYDTNDDGVGDLRGITEKLQYLHDTGFDALWLNPIFESPQVDFGYDISDYMRVDPLFGTNDDLETLFDEAKKLGIKVILDFVPNHTSNQHEWFWKSEQRLEPFADFYVWHPGKPNPKGGRPLPPNNWQSSFYGSAWEWSELRQEFYLHQYAVGQPDLNYRNPGVVKSFDEVLLFWMRKGASGFRLDAVNRMFEVQDLRNEPVNDPRDPLSYRYLHHIYTRDQPETYDVIAHWRNVLDEFSKQNSGVEVIMMTEAYSNLSSIMQYYQSEDGSQKRAHLPINFSLMQQLKQNSTAFDIKRLVDEWMNSMPVGRVPNWVLGSHDKPRIASRFGRERVEGMGLLLLGLPGVAVIYYGDEIGMEDFRNLSYADTVDPKGCNLGPDAYKWASRDPQRTPFQWNDRENAGFSRVANTWLPLHPNYREINLDQQRIAENSTYQFFVKGLKLRKDPVFAKGLFISRAFNKDVFVYLRYIDDSNELYFAVIINLSSNLYTININELYETNQSLVRLTSKHSFYEIGDTIKPSNVSLGPYDAIVISNK